MNMHIIIILLSKFAGGQQLKNSNSIIIFGLLSLRIAASTTYGVIKSVIACFFGTKLSISGKSGEVFSAMSCLPSLAVDKQKLINEICLYI